MPRELVIQVSPKEASSQQYITEALARELSIAPSKISGFHIVRQSIDARKKHVAITLRVLVFIEEPFRELEKPVFHFNDVRTSNKRTLVVGAGPAGLFAALELIEKGIKPIVIERGKNVRDRRRDLALLNRVGILNENSNYCFGEGGAGTYSDGKLYTRSTKRGNVLKVLELLVFFGADPSILTQAHPHIGTNKLPGIIEAIREQIIQAGGEIHFNEQITELVIKNDQIHALKSASGNTFQGNQVILATGHSAKDIFFLLHANNILLEAKPFALGVRVEHPQALIDSIQYHCPIESSRGPFLPPASYQLVEQCLGRGVFSFCMCPGGIIATASTSQQELVVNGWSPSKRNNPFANSGMVVQVGVKDVWKGANGSLVLHDFQEAVERRAFEAGGGKFVAPAQRLMDFINNISSSTLPDNSYIRGVSSVNLGVVLPDFILASLREGFKTFGKKMKGYLTNEAIVVAPESRTSSPVRIPRDTEKLHHPQIKNLYPCGEGAGYAGGIVSAAMDGQKVAAAVHQFA